MKVRLQMICRQCEKEEGVAFHVDDGAGKALVRSDLAKKFNRLWEVFTTTCKHVDPCGSQVGSEHTMGDDGACVDCGRKVATVTDVEAQ